MEPSAQVVEARVALGEHAARSGAAARDRYGPIDADAIFALLEDRSVVRFPVSVDFDAAPLKPGEFGWAEPRGSHPREGFRLHLHPRFRERRGDLPYLIAYHLVTVNYGDVATSDDAEAFGAALLGLDRDAYYERVCRLADELEAVSGACTRES